MHIQHKDITFDIQRKDKNTLIINGKEVSLDGSSDSKIFLDGKAYNVEFVEENNRSKKIYINNVLIDFDVKTDLEHRLDQMGIVAAEGMKASEIVAPMPGKIVDVLVKESQNIESGETVIILEAMKMENGIKIDFNTNIKEILVKKGDTVEKGEKLILLD
jgi:biotin carboxyl carrier protein